MKQQFFAKRVMRRCFSTKLVAGNRTGHPVPFKAQKLQGVMASFASGNGKPIPLGAKILVKGVSDVFYVTEDSSAFVAYPLGQTVQAELRWRGLRCEFELTPLQEEPQALPQIGPIPCPNMLP